MSRILPDLIEKYKEERRKKNQASTVNLELARLKTAFNHAIDKGKASTNPVRKIKMCLVPASRCRFLSRDEARLLVEACDSVLRPMVVLALHTGMRKMEVLNLKWEHIDWDNRLIWLGQTKSGRSEYVPMDKGVVRELKAVKSNRDSPFVFHKKKGAIRVRFLHALKKAGITDCTFHTLRHTYASHLVMAGVDLATVRELMRHRDL